jgi:hypothetical protein
MGPPRALRDKQLNGLADQFAPAVAEQSLGLSVDQRYAAVAFYAHHGVGRCLQQP